MEYNTNNYPFMKYYTKIDSILNAFSNIKNAIPAIEKYNNYSDIYWVTKTNIIQTEAKTKLYRILQSDDIYEKINFITDYFVEDSRIKCQFKNYEPPEIFYKKNKEKIIKELENKKIKITPQNLNNYLYENHHYCTTFFIDICAMVYTLTDSKIILDFSSGWGDRLIAACGLNKKYIGIDPNGNNHGAYKNIIQTLNCNAKVYRSGAEYLPLSLVKNEKIDLIFTSPPYFDYEIYNSVAQSNNTFSTSEDWTVYFLFLVLNKYIPILETNGHLGLYIQDLPKKLTVVEPIYMFLNDYFPEFELKYILLKKAFPLYIYQKTTKLIKKNKLLEKYYPKLDTKVKNMIRCKLVERLEMTSRFQNNTIYDEKNTILSKFYIKLLIDNTCDIIKIIASPEDTELITELKNVTNNLNKKLEIYIPSIFNNKIDNAIIVNIPENEKNPYMYIANKVGNHFKYSSNNNLGVLEELIHEVLGYYNIDHLGTYTLEHSYSSNLMKNAIKNVLSNSKLVYTNKDTKYLKFN